MAETLMVEPELHDALKRWFGFDHFRPGQEAVVRDALAGRDLLAVMPTGGGKSLCFQLPALLRPGVMIVVSPLIALMQDQVRLLGDMGIPATFLNSSLSGREGGERMAALLRGEIKLLYLAPERLLMPEFLDGFMARLMEAQGIAGITIDEAHCVSEWGHDFRPEYRQMGRLREHFPDVPVFAFTATATTRVRIDIMAQLRLHEGAALHVASFNRPNLYYEVKAKDSRTYATLLSRIKDSRSSGIIYCLSRKRVDELSQRLIEDGVKALPYHAGLNADTRRDNQESYIRDDVQVMVATVAFGMGINKPDVRWVMHYDLPKTMEGYYQEAGRAGRDGEPARCTLFFGAGDIRTAEFLIEQKVHPETGAALEDEQRLARGQLRQVLNYAESHDCRRAIQLKYFGEDYEGNCGACDNCTEARATEDWTLEARQLLSCLARLAQRNERYGAAHVIDILRGAETQKLIDRGHQQLSVYGIGKQRSQDEWRALVRGLLHQGLLEETHDGYPVLRLVAASREVLKGERSVVIVPPPKKEKARKKGYVESAGAQPLSAELFDQLRALRKQLADAQNLPPYVVFSDATLREMAERQPTNADAFADVSGVGSRKLAQYGAAFTQAIFEFRQARGLAVDAAPSDKDFAPAPPSSDAHDAVAGSDSVQQTRSLFQRGLDLAQIAEQRGLSANTVAAHLETLLATGEPLPMERLIDARRLRDLLQALEAHGHERLRPAWESLKGACSYEDLRLARGWLLGRARREGVEPTA